MYKGKKIVQPPHLKPGDKVALVSPAYWVAQEALQLAAETLKSWGLQPVIGPNTNNLNVNAYAGTAEAGRCWTMRRSLPAYQAGR